MRLILFLLLWLLSGYLHALPDDLRSALKEPLQVAWDNLEGGSEWLSGPPPRYRDGFHWVTLESAEKLSFRFYRHSAIRVMSKTNPSVEGISVAVSDGSGLFITLEPEQLADGTWLYTNPLEVPGIALINNTSPDSQYRRFALFTKREALSPAPEPYRHRINLDLPTISLSENDNHGSETFQRMLSGQQASVEMSGPVRLLVENRFHYAPDHDSTSADYRLSVQLDDEPASTLLFSTSPEYRRQIYVDGQPIVSGRSEKAVIEVPAGEHRLTLSADANILLRLRQMQTDDFLFPELNRPMAWDKGLHSQNHTSQAVRQSQVHARSNRIRAGGLVAVDKLARLAAETAHNDISASIASLRNRHLLSRPLLPDTPATGIYSASFSTPRMLDRQESRSGFVARQ
ncbi:MAG: hypothetical protein R3260_15900, partial [Pseudomonas sp.]|nr:hypothetical protein [Pseudomonas sp.]